MARRGAVLRGLGWLLILGCGGGGGGDITGPVTPPAPAFTVEGRVLDSVAARGIPNATVRLGAMTTQTDAAGAFKFDKVSPGSTTITADASTYDSRTLSLNVSASQSVDLELRRHKPWLFVFTSAVGDEKIAARFLDLQGGLSISARNSTFRVEAPGYDFTSTFAAESWAWSNDEPLVLKFVVWTRRFDMNRVTYTVRDTTGNTAIFVCAIGGGCTEN